LIDGLYQSWGPILEVWEGYAADPEMHFNGSSGGVASALALYCLEKEGAHGVLHTAADERDAIANRTVLSRNRSEILDRTGSRYSPASPCSALHLIESAPGPCVFIGKPCDVAGLGKAVTLKPSLGEKVGAVIGIFCAGTPSAQGTIDLLKKHHINADDISALRYRGQGWPGQFSAQHKSDGKIKALTYKESWGFVQAYRPYRCYLCPDATGELADISCGDAWYREIKENDSGYSVVLVRTERGKRILQGAIESGYLEVERAKPEILHLSQKGMPVKRGAVWGRVLALKAFGLPVPRYVGFSLFKGWLRISTEEKARSIIGTIRRIIKRKYYRKLIINRNDARSSQRDGC
jgi:coenzyme F420 hydrogenase subunit beta